jgi:hypothetical protein
LDILEKKIPDRTALIETLMNILYMEKGAIYRRLRGEVPFSFFEVVNIADKLNISLSSFLLANSARKDHFTLSIVEYTDIGEKDYRQWEDYISYIRQAKNDALSEIAESSNILPISIYARFDLLAKFFLFKYHYQFSGSGNRISFGELVMPERLSQIYRSYFVISKKFANTIYVWDYLIFKYLTTDICFFAGINLLSKEDIRQIKNDLLALIDYVEQIALNGCFIETGNPVLFYISDINLDGDYSYLRFNNIYISHVRAFILNSVVSTDKSSFDKINVWIHSLTKSSTLITQSGAVFRADFFDEQRKIVSKL